MINRLLLLELQKWVSLPERKPMILRGARQVGKTSLVRELGKKHFSNFIELNLENKELFRALKGEMALNEFFEFVRVYLGADLTKPGTLLFIDEIQECPWLIGLMRFFLEERPELAVIGSGSLLEIKLKKTKLSIPVGRIENRYLHPLSFYEHLDGIQENEILTYLKNINWNTVVPQPIHDKALNLFQRYSILGGMPEVNKRFIGGASSEEISGVKNDLISTYLDDVRKYSTGDRSEQIEFVLEHAPLYAGNRFVFEKFANSRYRSEQMRKAFDALQAVMLLNLAEATDKLEQPIIGQRKRQRKLIFLDVGLVSHRFGLTLKSPPFAELAGLFRGQIAEQVVGQNLLSMQTRSREKLHYWAKQSTDGAAEVDFLCSHNQTLIALEVKSGSEGRLRSLMSIGNSNSSVHLFRIYSGPIKIEKREKATIYSLPFYLLPRIFELAEIVPK